VHAQDSSDPTGVAKGPGQDRTAVRRARERKSNAAIQMKLAGATWADIAKTLGYPTARQALVATEKALERQLHTEDRDAMRRLAGARLDRLLLGVWPKAIDGEHPEHLLAVTKAREIVDRHAKLFGLDAPTEFVVHSPTQSQLEEWVAAVTALRVPDVEEYDILEGEIIPDDEPRALGG